MRLFLVTLAASLLACTLGATDTGNKDGDDCAAFTETCNGLDDDCDGEVDNDVADPPSWYADDDADGYGDIGESLAECDAPAGFVADNTDCNDAATAINPAAEESGGNEVDENCDGVIDETCGSHAPSVVIESGEYDPEYDFGGTTKPAISVVLELADEDGDLYVVVTSLWIDEVADGVVDTTGAPTYVFSPFVFDNDEACDELDQRIQYTVEGSDWSSYAAIDVAVAVEDAVGHQGEAAVVTIDVE